MPLAGVQSVTLLDNIFIVQYYDVGRLYFSPGVICL